MVVFFFLLLPFIYGVNLVMNHCFHPYISATVVFFFPGLAAVSCTMDWSRNNFRDSDVDWISKTKLALFFPPKRKDQDEACRRSDHLISSFLEDTPHQGMTIR